MRKTHTDCEGREKPLVELVLSLNEHYLSLSLQKSAVSCGVIRYDEVPGVRRWNKKLTRVNRIRCLNTLEFAV